MSQEPPLFAETKESPCSREQPPATDSFGDLRALLMEPPSEELWHLIWKYLVAEKDPQHFALLLQYLREHLAHWPEGLRSPASSLKPVYYSSRPKHRKTAESERTQELLSLVDKLTLSQHSNFTASDLKYLVENPLCRHLKQLELPSFPHDDAAWDALMLSPHLGQLKHLRLTSVRCDEAGLTVMLQSPWFRQLEQVHFSHCTLLNEFDTSGPMEMPCLTEVSQDGGNLESFWEMLHTATEAPAIETLTISGRTEPSPSFEELLKEWAGRSLKTLTHTEQHFSPSQLHKLMEQIDAFPHLESVHWVSCGTTTDQLIEAFGNKPLPSLKYLDLSQNNNTFFYSTTTFDEVVSSLQVEQLETLRLEFNHLNFQAIKRTVQLPQLEHAKELNLRGTEPDTEDLKALFLESTCEQLTHLDLRNNKLSQAKGKILLGAHQLKQLKELHVSGNPLGDKCILGIATNKSTPQLERLSCISCGLSVPGWYTLLTNEDLPKQLRMNAWGDLLDQCNAAELKEILVDFGHKPKSSARKAQLVAMVQQVLTTKAELQKLLSHKNLVNHIDGKGLKATLRLLGQKKYSGLRADQLRSLALRLLREQVEELPRIPT